MRCAALGCVAAHGSGRTYLIHHCLRQRRDAIAAHIVEREIEVPFVHIHGGQSRAGATVTTTRLHDDMARLDRRGRRQGVWYGIVWYAWCALYGTM